MDTRGATDTVTVPRPGVLFDPSGGPAPSVPGRALRSAAAPAGFWVLLGPDRSGKSSVLSAVAERTGWPAVSYDDEFLGDRFPLIARLRNDFMSEALPGAGDRYSADLVLTVLQAAVVFLRDQAMACGATGPALVDSYYYKILVKCRLSGFVNEQLFAWWRSFPPPRGVIYLDTDPATAWGRADAGAALNGFEYYGDRPTWQAFARFQRDLRRLLLAETRHVRTCVVGSGSGVAELAGRVEEMVRSEHAIRR